MCDSFWLKTLFLILFICSTISTSAQKAERQFEAVSQAGMKRRQVPGMITAVYYQGRLVFSKTYGLKNVEGNLPVDRQTVFNLGSATKPFIGVAMGILVDQGKLDWDDKVIDHYANFKLSDPYTTKDARIKDLFLHNLGIASGDLLWTLDSTSTEEMLQRYTLSEKIHPIRAGFHYNNLMYVIAGEVIKAVSGMHWSVFVKENIFRPLDMNHSFAVSKDVLAYGNYATPYMLFNGQLVSHSVNQADQMGAAGNIWSCLEDMEHFLEFLVGEGNYKGEQILSKQTFRYLYASHTLENAPEMDELYTVLGSDFRNYGIGWFLHDYRGEKVIYHPGSIEGLNAHVGFVPSQKLAFVTMCNRDWAELWRTLMYKAMDLWVYQDNSNDYMSLAHNPGDKYIQEWELSKISDKDPDAKPKFESSELIGTYENPMLGIAVVSLENNRLQVIFNDYIGFSLEQWFDDTYLGRPVGKCYDWEEYFEFNSDTLMVFGEAFLRQEH